MLDHGGQSYLDTPPMLAANTCMHQLQVGLFATIGPLGSRTLGKQVFPLGRASGWQRVESWIILGFGIEGTSIGGAGASTFGSVLAPIRQGTYPLKAIATRAGAIEAHNQFFGANWSTQFINSNVANQSAFTGTTMIEVDNGKCVVMLQVLVDRQGVVSAIS